MEGTNSVGSHRIQSATTLPHNTSNTNMSGVVSDISSATHISKV
jgi:hypothetical protein